jgi:hypothetical protein
MFKRSLKSNHRVPRKNKVDTHGTPVLHLIVAPVLVAKMCTTSNEHSMYIRFLCYRHMLTSFSKYKLVLYNVFREICLLLGFTYSFSWVAHHCCKLAPMRCYFSQLAYLMNDVIFVNIRIH